MKETKIQDLKQGDLIAYAPMIGASLSREQWTNMANMSLRYSKMVS